MSVRKRESTTVHQCYYVYQKNTENVEKCKFQSLTPLQPFFQSHEEGALRQRLVTNDREVYDISCDDASFPNANARRYAFPQPPQVVPNCQMMNDVLMPY